MHADHVWNKWDSDPHLHLTLTSHFDNDFNLGFHFFNASTHCCVTLFSFALWSVFLDCECDRWCCDCFEMCPCKCLTEPQGCSARHHCKIWRCPVDFARLKFWHSVVGTKTTIPQSPGCSLTAKQNSRPDHNAAIVNCCTSCKTSCLHAISTSSALACALKKIWSVVAKKWLFKGFTQDPTDKSGHLKLIRASLDHNEHTLHGSSSQRVPCSSDGCSRSFNLKCCFPLSVVHRTEHHWFLPVLVEPKSPFARSVT